MPELKEEIGEFLQDIYPLLYKETTVSTTSTLQVSENTHLICKLLTEVVKWAEKLVDIGHLYEVNAFSYSCPTRFMFM